MLGAGLAVMGLCVSCCGPSPLVTVSSLSVPPGAQEGGQGWGDLWGLPRTRTQHLRSFGPQAGSSPLEIRILRVGVTSAGRW